MVSFCGTALGPGAYAFMYPPCMHLVASRSFGFRPSRQKHEQKTSWTKVGNLEIPHQLQSGWYPVDFMQVHDFVPFSPRNTHTLIPTPNRKTLWKNLWVNIHSNLFHHPPKLPGVRTSHPCESETRIWIASRPGTRGGERALLATLQSCWRG